MQNKTEKEILIHNVKEYNQIYLDELYMIKTHYYFDCVIV